MSSPAVVALHFNTGSRAPLIPVDTARAEPDQGLMGDRSRRPNRAVLFMEQETLDRFGLASGAVREQVTVRRIVLADLPPLTRLRIGTAAFEAGGLCSPCERMNELKPGLRAELEGRRGRFFRVVQAGAIAVGDAITLLPPVGAPST
jgi:MOSC domain-containing protein YiiM